MRQQDIEIIDKRLSHTLPGRLGMHRQHTVAVVVCSDGECWPVVWDGVESYDLDTDPHTLEDALDTASVALDDARR